ncbi:MAG: TlpA family protein disulfide reductase [Rhodocyclaceae bacterium]|nr:TlpA family protein disulfide reductase [Rhodocyclaceae bacterium]
MNLRFLLNLKGQLITAVAACLLIGLAVFMFTQNSRAPMLRMALIDGQVEDSAQWQGKVVVVNFWATSCPTCVHEMPALSALFERQHGPDFQMVAVAMAYDAPARVRHFAAARALPFKVALDARGEIAAGFGDVALTPTTLLIDRNGRIVERISGAPDLKRLEAKIQALIAAPV